MILSSLPLDVLAEIFSRLFPPDLLALARTSKPFRSFLLGSTAPFIWRLARRNLDGLPEPPAGMGEVHYASLVFGYGCHYKGCDRKARDTVWHLRIRSCAGCRPKHQPINVSESRASLAVCAVLGCHPDALQQYIPCGPFLNSKGRPVKGFQESHVKSFSDDLCALPLSERQAYLDCRRQATQQTARFADAGVAWQLGMKRARITQLRGKRAARAEIIRDGLVAIGFGEEISHFGWERIRKHRLISSSTKPLSDEARLAILTQLREYMLSWRELRMEEQVYAFRRQVFVDAWLQFTTKAFCGAPGDLAYFPLPPTATIGFSESIDSVIRQPGPISPESLLDQLHAAFSPACEYVLDWHRSRRRELASLLPDYKAEDDDEAVRARLSLAASVFHCNGPDCRGEGRTLAYPEILFHPCFTLVRPGDGQALKDPRNIAKHKACLAMGGNPWECRGRVQVHPKQDVVNSVLLCCGKDPRSTTAAEMDAQDPRLVCPECVSRHKITILMTWRRAVRHAIALHPDTTNSRPWIMACRTVRALISTLEPRNLRPFPSVLGNTLRDHSICLLCPPRISSWDTRCGLGDLLGHIQNKHGVVSPVFGKDYAFDENVTPVYVDPLIITRCRVVGGR